MFYLIPCVRENIAEEIRPSTDKRFIDVKECSDMRGYFVSSAMFRYHASDPVIRRAIAEYEDGSDDYGLDEEIERSSGYYTQAEYDDINRSSAYDNDYDDYN